MSSANKRRVVSKSAASKSNQVAAAPKKQPVFLCPAPIGGRVVLSIEQAAAKLGVCRTQPYRYMKDPDLNFPRPIIVSSNKRAFYEDEIDEWLQNRPRA